MVLADFPGNRQTRAVAYAGLGINGAVLITLGTLVSPHAWLAVPLMFLLGRGGDVLGCAQRDDRGGTTAHAADLRAARVHATWPDRRTAARLGDRARDLRSRLAVPAAAAPLRRVAQARRQGGHRIGRPPRGQGQPQRSGARDAGAAGELPRCGLPTGRAVRGQSCPRAGGGGSRMACRSGQRRGGPGAAGHAGTRHPGAAVFGGGSPADPGGRSHDRSRGSGGRTHPPAVGRARSVPAGRRTDPCRTRRRRRRHDRTRAAEPPDHRGHHRGDRPGDRRCRRR